MGWGTGGIGIFRFRETERSWLEKARTCVDAPIILWGIGHLSVLSPHHFPRLSNQAELTDVDFYYRSLGDDPKIGVQWR